MSQRPTSRLWKQVIFSLASMAYANFLITAAVFASFGDDSGLAASMRALLGYEEPVELSPIVASDERFLKRVPGSLTNEARPSPVLGPLATIEWENVGSTFSTGGNWVGGTAPANSTGTDIGSFGSTGASAVNPDLTAARSINGISFLSGAYAYTFGSSTGSTLTIGTGGITTSATNTETLGSTFTSAISASQTWTSNSGATLDIEGIVELNATSSTARTLTNTGAGNFIYNGTVQNSFAGNNSILAFNTSFSGTATLSGANTHSGGTTLSASSGSFILGNKAAFGTGTAAINGVSISANTGLSGANALANTVTFGGNNTFTGSNNIEFSGAVTETASRTVTNNLSAGTLTFSNTFGLSSNAGINTLTVGGTGNTIISGVLANNGTGGTATSGNLIKSGNGTLTLSNSCTYSGTTTLNAGTLLVNGSIGSTGAVSVSGGTLGGMGTVTGPVSVASGGTVAPGTSPGILNVGTIANPSGVSFASGSTFSVEIGGTTPGNGSNNHDQLNVTGTVSLGNATLNVSSFNGFVPSSNQTFMIILNDGTGDAVTGTFNGLAEGATISTNFLGSGLTAKISYIGGDGNDVVISVLAPTAASVSISGRVLTADGRAVPGALVTVLGNNMEMPITVRSGPSGRYVVRDLEAGQTYIVSISSKRFRFRVPDRLVSLGDDLTGFDFIAIP